MRRLGCILALALAPLFGAAEAADPSLSVQGAGASGTAAQAQSIANQALGLAGRATPGSGPTLYVDPWRSASATPGFAGLSGADQSLALAGDKVMDLMRALSGGADRGAVLQRRDNMYYVGVDGEGGRWFASAEQAVSFMFQSLVAKSSRFNYDTKQNAIYGCAQDILCAVLAVVKDPYFTIATVTRGSTVTVSISGTGFSNAGGTPSVASSDGILVQSVVYAGPEQISATVQIAPTAKLGEHLVAVFNAGQGFQNAGVYKLIVADGAGAAPATQANTRAAAQALSLQTASSGLLAGDGAEQYWRIELTAPGTLTVTSSGGSDVKATLEDGGGAALANDEDGGGWYNFRLAKALAAGTYYLRVGHCCGGAGAYALSGALTP